MPIPHLACAVFTGSVFCSLIFAFIPTFVVSFAPWLLLRHFKYSLEGFKSCSAVFLLQTFVFTLMVGALCYMGRHEEPVPFLYFSGVVLIYVVGLLNFFIFGLQSTLETMCCWFDSTSPLGGAATVGHWTSMALCFGYLLWHKQACAYAGAASLLLLVSLGALVVSG